MNMKILTSTQVKKLGLDKVSVITADMLEGYTSIDYATFSGCTKLSSVIIPNSVTRIGERAFYKCTGLTSIEIPNSVTSIGDTAFYGCSGLTSVTIGNSVTEIENYAFMCCSSLTHIEIPNSVTCIGYGAFEGCSSLTHIEIPNSVTCIGYGAFADCCGLTSVTIGDKTYEKQVIVGGKCKAYKGFNADMTCRDFQYEEGETYEYEGEPILCEQGFHVSLSLLDVFNYYWGELGKDIVIHEVELEDVTDKRNEFDSKIVAKKITIGKRIL